MEDWSSTAGNLSEQTETTEGARSLGVVPSGWTQIASIPLSSPGNVSDSLSYDIRLPETVHWGETRAVVQIPSQQVYWMELGSQSLSGLEAGSWHSLQFPLSNEAVNALEASYDDLVILLILNAPTLGSPYLFDNLRVTGNEPDPGDTETLTLGFELPEASFLGNLVLGANEYMRLADQVELDAEAAVANGDLEAGNDSELGTLRASGDLKIGHRTDVSGDAIAGDTLTLEPTTVVSGVTQSDTGAEPGISVEWTVKVPVTNLGNIQLEPDQERDVQPGRYGNLWVKPGSTATLHTGVYAFSSVQIEPQGTLLVDDREGPVQLVVDGGLVFRGAIVDVDRGLPQILFAVQGTQDVFVEAPFRGVILAPNAPVRFQAALPEGHHALAFAQQIWLEPETKILQLPFDWDTVVGPGNHHEDDEGVVIHSMPDDDLDLTVDIPAEGGTPTTSSDSADSPKTFRLPETWTVEGGIIGNGTVVVRFDDDECTYHGMSSSSAPETPEELTLGSVLDFEECSDGLPHDAERTATNFGLEVTPIPGYPVTVQAPLQGIGCSESFELLNPVQTMQMRQGFTWNSAVKVDEQNAEDGTPTLYYAWVHVGSKQDALALKQLYIHVLTRPLFDQELLAYAGRCGTFTNPGDGAGAFVPALIPGATYNALIDALTSDDIEGDRVIFDAVILRDVPDDVRNNNGSVQLQALGESGFRYLDYDVNPLRPQEEIVLEGGKKNKVFVSALAWVGQKARDAGEVITGVLNEIEQFITQSEITVHLDAYALTQDDLFQGDVMVRGWGQYGGKPLGATGMQVKILQKLFGTRIPTTAKSTTNIVGHTHMDVAGDADMRGRGLCVELGTRGAMVTSFLIADELCDLRAYDSLNSPATEVEDFHLKNLDENPKVRLHIDNTRLTGLYQADDVFRYSEHVIGYTPKRARILSGRWATTFTSTNEDGSKRLYAPCLNFPNSLTDLMIEGAVLAGGIVGGLVGGGVGAPVGATAAATFASVVGNTDIVMSTESNLRFSRGVMSHEYGHYMFCNMLYDAEPDAVDHIVWATVIRAEGGDELDFPLRYMNEAIADFFEGQVASGIDYSWGDPWSTAPSTQLSEGPNSANDQYCSDRRLPCWDLNLDGTEPDDLTDPEDQGTRHIGRVATLMMDMFDGHGAARTADEPTDGDAWHWDAGRSRLVWSPNADGNDDSTLESAAMTATGLRTFVGLLAQGMEPFFVYDLDDTRFEAAGYAVDNFKILTAANLAMLSQEVSWCDRCSVLALHDDGANKANRQELWQSCQNDATLSSLVGESPEPDLRLNALDCSACPPGETSDVNGQCVPCADTVVGNDCIACAPDIVLDGATLAYGIHEFDTTQTATGDTCPNVLVVEVQDPHALFLRADFAGFSAEAGPLPETQANCEREYTLITEVTGGRETLQSAGSWPVCPPPGDPCFVQCSDTPRRVVTEPQIPAGSSVRFSAPALPNSAITVFLSEVAPDPE